MSDERSPDQSGLVSSGARGLTTRPLSLVRRGLEALLAQQPCVIHFPPDRSIGSLWLVCDRAHNVGEQWKEILRPGVVWNSGITDSLGLGDDDMGYSFWGHQKYLGEARGEVAVPAGKQLHLEIDSKSEEELSKLSFLTTLPPNELQNIGLSFYWRSEGLTGDAILVHLRGLAALQVLDLSNAQVSDAGLVHLKELTALRRLALSNTQISDAGLTYLKELTALQVLDLSDTQVSDAGLVHLKELMDLQELSLGSGLNDDCGAITDAGLVYLRKFTNLRVLSLSQQGFSDAGLVHLKELAALQVLDLSDTQVSLDAGLVHLKELTALQILDLHFTDISDAGLVHLKELNALRKLDLGGTKVSDAGLVHLQGLTRLEKLILSDTMVSGTGLAYLRGLTGLQELYVSKYMLGCEFGDAGLVHLKELTGLQRLDLHLTGVTDAGLIYLKELIALQVLDLSRTEISDAGLVHLSDLAALQALNLYGTEVSDAGLVYLSRLSALRRLNVSDTRVSDAGVKELRRALPNCDIEYYPPAQVLCFPSERAVGTLYAAVWGKWEKLGEARGSVAVKGRERAVLSVHSEASIDLSFLNALKEGDLWSLNLSYTQVSDSGLVHIQRLAGLQMLSLVGTRVSDAGLVHLQGLTNLRKLDLQKTQVSDAGLVHLLGLTHLEELNLSETQVTHAGEVKLRRALPSNLLYSEDDPPARFLYFPPDHSVGKLYIYPRSASSDAKWEELGEARGSIKVRVAHWWVWLSVSPGAATDFSFLTALNEDDLLSLDLAYTQVCDADLVHLWGLTGLKNLDLSETQVSNAGVADLQRALPNCSIWTRRVHFPETRSMGTLFVRNQGSARSEAWEALGEARGYVRVPREKELCLVVSNETSTDLLPLTTLKPDDLQWLGLPGQVNDAGLVHLRGLTGLHGLWLSNTQVSDAGLVHLRGLAALQMLSLKGTRVSDTAVADLQRALPRCRIER